MRTESKNIEFKREYVDDIKKTVVAFANTDGGELLIGVDDDGAAVGLADPHGTLLRAVSAVRDAIRPDVTMFAECAQAEANGKQIVSITVQRGTARPYYLAGKGVRPEGVFVRQGASTVPASEAAILAMIKETSGDSYELARSLNQQLAFDRASESFAKKGIAFGNMQKRSLGLIGSDGTFTNLALLLSEQCTHAIKLAVFDGVSKTVFKDRREFGGSLFQQLDDAYGFIDRYNSLRSEFQGVERIDKRDYPAAAIREALLNALVHRDYGLSPATLVSIFDNRIEIVTIGGLVKGITLSDIMLGVSALRNPRLAEVFYRLGLIEAYGTGIPKIIDSYKGFDMRPAIDLSDNAFKITLPNTNHPSGSGLPLGDREARVLGMLRGSDSVTRAQVQEALGVSQATAISLLRDMLGKGLLSTAGSGKNLAYKRRR